MYEPTNIDYYLHAKRVLYKKIRKAKGNKPDIPGKMIKRVLTRMYRKIMAAKITHEDDVLIFIPRFSPDEK